MNKSIGTHIVSISDCLATWLSRRCRDRSVKWAYHPQSSGVGQTIVQHTLSALVERNGSIARALHRGHLAATFNAKIVGKRRAKTVDLAIGTPADLSETPKLRPGEILTGAIDSPLLMVEVKSCMTAHQKARPRLVSELLSTLEVAEGLSPRPALLGFIVMNFSQRFTSPKNLPGPNRHESDDAERALEQVFSAVPSGGKEGYDALVVVPIDFDNESGCRISSRMSTPFGIGEQDALAFVDRRVARAMRANGLA